MLVAAEQTNKQKTPAFLACTPLLSTDCSGGWKNAVELLMKADKHILLH